MKKFIIILLTLCGAAIFAQGAGTPEKFALIIYNANYNENRSLNYPLQDMSDTVESLKKKLREKGWTVVDFIQDGSRNEMEDGIDSLIKNLDEANKNKGNVIISGLFYFIGHARETYGVNYLYPVRNTPINDVRKQAISVNDVVNGIKKANGNGKNFIIIDYSRNQPYNGMMGARRRAVATRWSNLKVSLVQRQ